MRIQQLDEDYALSRRKLWPKAFKLGLCFITIMWAVFIADWLLPFVSLSDFGIRPRHLNSLRNL